MSSIRHSILPLVLFFAASTAFAHAKLLSSTPVPSSVVTEAPKEIRLTYNEELEVQFSKITLSDAQHADVSLPPAQLDKSNSKILLATLPTLKPGTYQVQWSAMTRDGHKTKGQFTFQVK